MAMYKRGEIDAMTAMQLLSEVSDVGAGNKPTTNGSSKRKQPTPDESNGDEPTDDEVDKAIDDADKEDNLQLDSRIVSQSLLTGLPCHLHIYMCRFEFKRI